MKQKSMQAKTKEMKRNLAGSLLVLTAALLSAGCGGGKTNSAPPPEIPAGSQGSQSHNYVGTQSLDGSGVLSPNFKYGGTWAITLDDTTKYFSYQNIGHEGYEGVNLISQGSTTWVFPDAVPTVGASTGSGFLNLAATSGSTTGAAGYAVEVPGEAALLRPGDDTMSPVISVATTGCPTLSGNVTYQFIGLGSPARTDKNTHVAYGSLQASNSATTWNFTNLNMYTFDGTSLSPTALPTGNCGYTQLGYAVSIAPSTATNGFTVTTAVSPSGYFIMDQGQGEVANGYVLEIAGGGSGSYGPTGPLGLVGVQQPSSALNTSSIVSGKYLGFEFDPVDDSLGKAGTWPVIFGQTAGSGTIMTGGAFPNDDPTQTAPSNITLDLGPQDAKNNGLYTNVTVTVPDIHKGCVQEPFGGTDADGNPTCNFHGVAVVGNPAGKFAIFVTVNDLSQAVSHYAADAALHFFLYQQ
jgi:hypothetical protein